MSVSIQITTKNSISLVNSSFQDACMRNAVQLVINLITSLILISSLSSVSASCSSASSHHHKVTWKETDTIWRSLVRINWLKVTQLNNLKLTTNSKGFSWNWFIYRKLRFWFERFSFAENNKTPWMNRNISQNYLTFSNHMQSYSIRSND